MTRDKGPDGPDARESRVSDFTCYDGLSDGATTEIINGELREGMRVVVGESIGRRIEQPLRPEAAGQEVKS